MTVEADTAFENNLLVDVFNQLDADNDGLVTATEIFAILQQIDPEVTPAEVADLVAKLGGTETGVSQTVFVNAIGQFRSKYELSGKDQYYATFNMMDKNKNGILERSELREGLAILGELVENADLDLLMEERSNEAGLTPTDFVRLLESHRFASNV